MASELEQMIDDRMRRIYSKAKQEKTPNAVYVCNRVGDTKPIFDDDCFGQCSECGAEVRYRPYKPHCMPLICLQCCKIQIEGEGKPNDG